MQFRRHRVRIRPQPRCHRVRIRPQLRRHRIRIGTQTRRHRIRVRPQLWRHRIRIRPQPRRHRIGVRAQLRRHGLGQGPQSGRDQIRIGAQPRRYRIRQGAQPRRHRIRVRPQFRRDQIGQFRVGPVPVIGEIDAARMLVGGIDEIVIFRIFGADMGEQIMGAAIFPHDGRYRQVQAGIGLGPTVHPLPGLGKDDEKLARIDAGQPHRMVLALGPAQEDDPPRGRLALGHGPRRRQCHARDAARHAQDARMPMEPPIGHAPFLRAIP